MFRDRIISDYNISSGNKNIIYNDSFVFGNKTIFLRPIVPTAYK